MTEWLQPILGFLSAGLVALVALAFGAMFLFFAGSAALVLGQFLPFARAPRVAGLALLGATLLLLCLALLLAIEPLWLLPAGQLVWGATAYGLLRWRAAHRPLRWVLAGLLLASAGLFLVSLALPAFERIALGALGVVANLTVGLLLGFWPLVVGGLVAHAREKPVEWFISLRYLLAKRRQTFISVITVICVVGVALGVAVISVVLSVFNGFHQVWETKIIGARAHFAVHSQRGYSENYREIRDRIVGMPGVEGAAPYLETEAILRSDSGDLQAIVLKGIDPETVGDVTALEDDLIAGSLADLGPTPADEGLASAHGLIVGSELADRFLLRLGDPLILISPLGGPPTPLGPAPRMQRFRVAGVFRAGFVLFDESYIYASMAGVQEFMKLGDVASGIEVRTSDPYRSQAIARQAMAALGGGFFAQDWKQFYPGFFNALKTERVMMFVLLSFIMVVAGFIIIATLIMMIMEKSRDIAILKAMGCPDQGIQRVFAIEGFLIGIAGMGLGLAMALVIIWNLERIQAVVERSVGFDVLPANVYQLQTLPYQIVPGELALIAAVAMVLAIGATLLPCWQAARLDPAEALRYE